MSVPENPYQAPESRINGPEKSKSAYDLSLFKQWEKLRLFYNLILIGETVLILLIHRSSLMQPKPIQLADSLLAGAIGANVCFCLGPVLNGYLEWFGLRGRFVQAGIFGLGTLVAMALTLLALGGPLIFGVPSF